MVLRGSVACGQAVLQASTLELQEKPKPFELKTSHSQDDPKTSQTTTGKSHQVTSSSKKVDQFWAKKQTVLQEVAGCSTTSTKSSSEGIFKVSTAVSPQKGREDRGPKFNLKNGRNRMLQRPPVFVKVFCCSYLEKTWDQTIIFSIFGTQELQPNLRRWFLSPFSSWVLSKTTSEKDFSDQVEATTYWWPNIAGQRPSTEKSPGRVFGVAASTCCREAQQLSAVVVIHGFFPK